MGENKRKKRKRTKKKGQGQQPGIIKRRISVRKVGKHTVKHRVIKYPKGRSITMVVTSPSKTRKKPDTDVVTHRFIPKNKKDSLKFLYKERDVIGVHDKYGVNPRFPKKKKKKKS